MPSRVHWVYWPAAGNPRFDHAARCYFQDYVRHKAMDLLRPAEADVVCLRIASLSLNWRKALPALQAIAVELGLTVGLKKLKQFRLPKRLRRDKNPIMSWRQLV